MPSCRVLRSRTHWQVGPQTMRNFAILIVEFSSDRKVDAGETLGEFLGNTSLYPANPPPENNGFSGMSVA